MAVLHPRSRMFHWKIYKIVQGSKTDVTSALNGVVSNFKITNGITSQKTSSKKESAPSQFEMTITSDNYVENIFTEGVELIVEAGREPLSLIEVFRGKIKQLPSGSARELLEYKVEAFGDEIKLSESSKNTLFRGRKKSEIIKDIIARNDIGIGKVSIKNDSKMGAGFQKIQKNLTDTELLDKLAAEWGCTWWYRGGEIYFIDFEDAFVEGDKIDLKLSKGMPVDLYYRSSLRNNNVETIKWNFSPAPGGSETEPMFKALTEMGENPGLNEYKLRYRGVYYQLRPPYLSQAKNDKLAFGKYVTEAIAQTAALNAEQVLHKFFEVVPDSQVKDRTRIPDMGDNAGVEITVHLNEADLTIFPPRSAKLFSGTLGRVPGGGPTDLPAWMFRFGDNNQSVAKLNIKETVLTFEEGMLKTELKCSMGVPVIGNN